MSVARACSPFWRTAVDGHAPTDVAADLGLSVNAVYVAKARLLRRLRAEYGDRVPVILVDGREHGFWTVEEPRLRAALAG